MKRRRDNPSLCILLLSLCVVGLVTAHGDDEALRPKATAESSIVVAMPVPGPQGVRHNDYMCTGASVPDQDMYITQFEPRADPRVAHHMLIFGCSNKAPRGSWACKSTGVICDSEPHIIFAWALNASGLHLPKDVGVHIGPSVGINSVVVQIHYGYPEQYPELVSSNQEAMVLHTTLQRQPYVAGIYLIGSGSSIQSGIRHSYVDSACRFLGPKDIYPFAFRTHAHHLGEQIAGYVVKNGEWQLIGTRSPQDPQAFYPAANTVEVHQGDVLAMRCVFNMEGMSHSVHMGANSEDEMCNFYIMYYTSNDGQQLYSKECWMAATKSLVYPRLPSLTTPTVPPIVTTKESVEEDTYECPKPIPPNSGNSRCINNTATTSPIPVPHSTTQIPNTDSTTPEPTSNPVHFFEGGDDIVSTSLEIVQAEDWLLNGVDIPGVTLGQVSAVAVDKEGSVHILHRGPVVWDYGSFNFDYTYRHKEDGPIKIPTMLKFSSIGTPQRAWGESTFYMPHGLTIDYEGNFWVTDVALHQVFKFTKLGSSEPAMILGTEFKPGSEFGHFCQPTSVAVESTAGSFYIADGYCNRRVLKFSASGQLLDTWKDPIGGVPLFVPHKLTLNAAQDRLFVADRENSRVISYDVASGHGEVLSSEMALGGKPFAVYTNGSNDWPMHGVFGGEEGAMGFSLDRNGKVIGSWGPEEGFTQPHDLTVDPVNNAVYVTEIGPNRIWKFVAINLSPTNTIDITDLLDSQLSPKPDSTHHETPRPPSSSDDNDIIPSDHNSGHSSNTQSPTLPSTTDSTPFVHGVLPDEPLRGSKPEDEGREHALHTESQPVERTTTQEGENGGSGNSSMNIEGSSSNGGEKSPKKKPAPSISVGIVIAVFVMVTIFVLILIGVLKEHKYLRFRGAVCLRRGKVPVDTNGKVNGTTSQKKKKKSNPRKALQALLGPSKLGFSRLRTYDSDSEEEEFPVFNRV